MRKIFLISFLSLIIFLPALAQAGVVPCGLSEDDTALSGDQTVPCEFCHFFVLFDKVYGFVLLNVVPGVAVVMIIIGGVLLFFAGESPEKLSQAKALFTYLLIGLVLIYGAWLLINLFFNMIGVNSWTGLDKGWWEIDCPITGTAPTTGGGGGGGGSNGTGGGASGGGLQGAGGTAPSNIPFQSGISSQWGDASSSLQGLITCMYSKDSNLGDISSISDSNIAAGTCDPKTCSSGCQHKCGSAHYGGTCSDGSYAVDFGDESKSANIQSAASQCSGSAGGSPWVNDEGDHIHVSIGTAKGCNAN